MTIHWSQRNRRATNHRSHLALIPTEKVFSGRDDILVSPLKSSADYAQSGTPFEQALDNLGDIPLSQQRPGPGEAPWKIPASEWPNVVRCVVENQEPLRKVAVDYGVSHETVRRVIKAAQKRTSSSIYAQELESQIESHPTSGAASVRQEHGSQACHLGR